MSHDRHGTKDMLADQHNPPPSYDPPVRYERMAEERDCRVGMRDGKQLCVDIYRPAAPGRFPALVSLAAHNKEFNTPEFAAAALNAQPAWSRVWMGGAEAGVMEEPPMKVWVAGENRWRQSGAWPLPETQWTRLYLHG